MTPTTLPNCFPVIMATCIAPFLDRFHHVSLKCTSRSWEQALRIASVARRSISTIPQGVRPDGLCLHEIENDSEDPFSSCSFSSDGSKVAASGQHSCIIFDFHTGKPIVQLEERFHTFMRDGMRFISSSKEGKVSLRQTDTGKLIEELPEQLNDHKGLCSLSPDGNTIAFPARDLTIRMWSVPSRKWGHILQWPTSGLVSCVFSPTENRLAALPIFIPGHRIFTITVWDCEKGELSHELNGHRSQIFSCQFSPDGQRIASTSKDGTIRLWNAVTGGERIHVWKWLPDTPWSQDTPTSCAFSPDSKTIACANARAIRIWKLDTGDLIRELSYSHDPDDRKRTDFWEYRSLLNRSWCAFSPDGSQIASVSREAHIIISIWNAATGQFLRELKSNRFLDCTWSPDGKTIASVGSARRKTPWNPQRILNLWIFDTSWWLHLLWNKLESHREPLEAFSRLALFRIQKDLEVFATGSLTDLKSEYIHSLALSITSLPNNSQAAEVKKTVIKYISEYCPDQLPRFKKVLDI